MLKSKRPRERFHQSLRVTMVRASVFASPAAAAVSRVRGICRRDPRQDAINGGGVWIDADDRLPIETFGDICDQPVLADRRDHIAFGEQEAVQL